LLEFSADMIFRSISSFVMSEIFALAAFSWARLRVLATPFSVEMRTLRVKDLLGLRVGRIFATFAVLAFGAALRSMPLGNVFVFLLRRRLPPVVGGIKAEGTPGVFVHVSPPPTEVAGGSSPPNFVIVSSPPFDISYSKWIRYLRTGRCA